MVAVSQHPGRHPGPAEGAVRREDAHVEQAVVETGVGQQAEPARQQPGVADDDRPRRPLDRRVVVQLDREPRRRPGEMRRPRHRVGEPAELVLELGPGHDRGVEAHPRHRRERLPVGDRQVDQPIVGRPVLVERDVEGRPRMAGDAERPRQQVGGAVRDDPERYAGRRHALGAAADGPVPAHRHHQVGAVEGRSSGRRDPGLGLVGDVEFSRPAVPGGDLAAERHEPPADPGQRAVNHKETEGISTPRLPAAPGPAE